MGGDFVLADRPLSLEYVSEELEASLLIEGVKTVLSLEELRMKCDSVQCLWSSAPPTHNITATAVLEQSQSIYTGGLNGSIIWWKVYSPLGTQNAKLDVKPIAMLCGHSAKITGLEICTPIIESRETSDTCSIESTSIKEETLISSCADGVLCIWSSDSGYCRRRRKLPPWAGSPFSVSSLYKSRRYVCVGCISTDGMQLPSNHAVESDDGGVANCTKDGCAVERESNAQPTSKGAIVIIDSCTLNIVQIILHGAFSIGHVQSMVVAPSAEKQNALVIMADEIGRLQTFSITEDCWTGAEDAKSVESVSTPESEKYAVTGCIDKRIIAVSIAPHGKVVALIFSRKCIFKSTHNGMDVGEISLTNSSLLDEDDSTSSDLSGGLFFSFDELDSDVIDFKCSHEDFVYKFVIWNNRGAAMVYLLSYSGQTLTFRCLCEIPAASYSAHEKLSINFCRMKQYIVRTESICFDIEDPLLWTCNITMCSACEPSNDESSCLPLPSIIMGESGLFQDWLNRSNTSKDSTFKQNKITDHSEAEILVRDGKYPEVSFKQLNDDDRKVTKLKEGQLVTSSVVLSMARIAPYAVAYGFYNGKIEVILLHNYFEEGKSTCDFVKYKTNVPKHSFGGHTGAVLCLADHCMTGTSQGSFEHVLISGSMDCTIRIWDLDTSAPISVLHHHIAPVRQIVLPPPRTYHPWSECFISVGDDGCVALISLDTLSVQRMFPDHPGCPKMVAWDTSRGYIANLVRKNSLQTNNPDSLYIWDVKTGARERVIHGTASHSMFDSFCRGIDTNLMPPSHFETAISLPPVSSHIINDPTLSIHFAGQTAQTEAREYIASESTGSRANDIKGKLDFSNVFNTLGQIPVWNKSTYSLKETLLHPTLHKDEKAVTCLCPFPGVSAFIFDLHNMVSLMQGSCMSKEYDDTERLHEGKKDSTRLPDESACTKTLEEFIFQFSLSFLHCWGVDTALDQMLVDEIGAYRPGHFLLAPGLRGDKDSLTLMFPGLHKTLEFWRDSEEFVAMRSLTMVSLAQRILTLAHPTSDVSSALAAFYTRDFAERVTDIKPPRLQLLASFWQDQSEHVRMAARSLFHCSAARAIPVPLKPSSDPTRKEPIHSKADDPSITPGDDTLTDGSNSDGHLEIKTADKVKDDLVVLWLESYESHDWVSIIGGTSQEARASHIIVAAALAVWYPSLVKPSLAASVAHQLVNSIMAVSDKYSATAAELLSEGMENTWKPCLRSELSHLIGDLFFLIECLNSTLTTTVKDSAVAANTRETFVAVLLPSLAVADIASFLNVIEGQIWANASDSSVHVIALKTLIRVVRCVTKLIAPFLDKVLHFILLTMDPANSVMRKSCLQTAMAALKEVVRVFPMVALNQSGTRLAFGDLIGDIREHTIQVYDLQSLSKVKVLDASGPPGLPSLMGGDSDRTITAGISVLSFSPDGEGLVAFSEHGLMIRWWSLGAAWWEKLSRNMLPIQCTKLILIPPWEGFSPTSSRLSIMGSIHGLPSPRHSQETMKVPTDAECLKALAHNVDLSYGLEWEAGRKITLLHHGHQLGTFQIISAGLA